MKTLIKATEKEILNKHIQFIANINKQKSTVEILGQWINRDRLPKGKDMSKFNLKELKEYLILRDKKATQKKLNENQE